MSMHIHRPRQLLLMSATPLCRQRPAHTYELFDLFCTQPECKVHELSVPARKPPRFSTHPEVHPRQNISQRSIAGTSQLSHISHKKVAWLREGPSTAGDSLDQDPSVSISRCRPLPAADLRSCNAPQLPLLGRC